MRRQGGGKGIEKDVRKPKTFKPRYGQLTLFSVKWKTFVFNNSLYTSKSIVWKKEGEAFINKCLFISKLFINSYQSKL